MATWKIGQGAATVLTDCDVLRAYNVALRGGD
jgi:hypothetical protein